MRLSLGGMLDAYGGAPPGHSRHVEKDSPMSKILASARSARSVSSLFALAGATSIALFVACGGSGTDSASDVSSSGGSSGTSGSSGASSGSSGSSGVDAARDDGSSGSAASPGRVSLVAGAGGAADVGSPTAIAYDGTNNVYIADNGLRLLKVDLTTAAVTTLAGSHHATGVAFDPGAGVLYYIDSIDAVLSKIDVATGTTTNVAGALGSRSAVDEAGAAARFLSPGRLTFANGKVYLTDGCAIRAFDVATSTVKTIAGSPTTCGYVEGSLVAARFGSSTLGAAQGGPLGLVMGPAQTLFVADRNNFMIRAVHLDAGMTELVAGSSYGHTDGVHAGASFQEVKDVTWDAAHARLYVAGTGGTIRRIQLHEHYADAEVTTVAGAWPGETAFAPGIPGSLQRPSAVAFVGPDVIGGDLEALFRVSGL